MGFPTSAKRAKMKTVMTDLPTCPDCGSVDESWWEKIEGNDDSYTGECDACGAVYSVDIEVSYSFSSVAVEGEGTSDEN